MCDFYWPVLSEHTHNRNKSRKETRVSYELKVLVLSEKSKTGRFEETISFLNGRKLVVIVNKTAYVCVFRFTK